MLLNKSVGERIHQVKYYKRKRRKYAENNYRVRAEKNEIKQLAEENKCNRQTGGTQDKHSASQGVERQRKPDYEQQTRQGCDIDGYRRNLSV